MFPKDVAFILAQPPGQERRPIADHVEQRAGLDQAVVPTREMGADADRIAPLRALIDAGVPVSLATDNVPPTMFHTIWHAATRRTQETGQPFAAEQCLTREEALACASREGAYLTFEEDEKGTLEPGKLADIAVLSDDPLAVDDDRLPGITADLTLVGGKIVYDRAEASNPSA